MSYAEIRPALQTQLDTVSGLPDSDHQADENSAFTGTPGKAWLKSRLRFGEETRLTMPAVGATLQKDGVWSLLLHFPLGAATDDADDLVASVVDAFPSGLTLVDGSTTVRIDASRRYGGGRDFDPNYYTVPVDIRWHVFATNPLT